MLMGFFFNKGKIKGSEPKQIQIDHSKPLPKSPPYPLKPEAIPGLSPTVEDLQKDLQFCALIPVTF